MIVRRDKQPEESPHNPMKEGPDNLLYADSYIVSE